MKLPYKYKGKIIVNPLMRGGILPEEVQKSIYGDGWLEVGYSLCFNCLEGRSDLVKKPNVNSFLGQIAGFFGGDVAQHTFGCRAAQFTVLKTIADNARENNLSRTIVVDSNSHYTTNIAAEMAGLKISEVPHSGYPSYELDPQAFLSKIEELEADDGRKPSLVVMTHADPYYGNLEPVEEVGKICEELEIPFMLNGAYTAGVMPVDMKKIKCDFLTLSAHKSMASLAPLGYVVTSHTWGKKVFATSSERPDWSGRLFGKKIPNLFGCSVGGLPLISSMMSFDSVVKRVKDWDEQLKNTRWFVEELENLGDIMLIGQNPHNHHLLHFETPGLWEISKTHKRRGFFLSEELEKRGIVGVHKGMTKHIKASVYGLSKEEIKTVRDAFQEIANK